MPVRDRYTIDATTSASVTSATGPCPIAARIAMLMPPVTASEAAALNLVAEVVPDEELDKTAADLARRLAEGLPGDMRPSSRW